MRYAEDESLWLIDVFFEVNGFEDDWVDLVGSRLLDLTADDADMRRCHACDLRPSVSSAVYFQRLGRTQHTDKTDDRPTLVAGSIADRLYSILSCQVR